MRVDRIRGAVVFCATSVVFAGSFSVASAFTEPTGTPATAFSPTVINVGPASQAKAGDLTVRDMKAPTITFGGEKRSSWLAASGSCVWEGWKCDCRSDDSGFASISLMMGVECSGGQIVDMKLLPLAVSSREKSCPASPPAPCAPALYSYKNNGGNTLIEKIVSGAVAVGKFAATVVTTPVKLAVQAVVAVAGFVADSWQNTASAVVSVAKAAVSVVSSVISAVKPVVKVLRHIVCFGFC